MTTTQLEIDKQMRVTFNQEIFNKNKLSLQKAMKTEKFSRTLVIAILRTQPQPLVCDKQQ